MKNVCCKRAEFMNIFQNCFSKNENILQIRQKRLGLANLDLESFLSLICPRNSAAQVAAPLSDWTGAQLSPLCSTAVRYLRCSALRR